MIRFLADWIDSRTNIKRLLNEGLYENIPSGARWRYITGSMLVFAFAVQAITGIFLWMVYSPSSQTAYESVYYIQHEMTGGWLVRGVHHFMAQAMVVVMGLHLLQVIVDSAYRAPREVNYWLGLVLMQLVMGLGLTGYLLPWDQKGYWATNVATNLMTLVPFVGKELQQLAVGGNEYGNATLTRFFAMHTGVLPALLVAFLGMHIAVFRKHGITAKITPGRPDEYFWPHQVLLDSIGCLVLLCVVLLCVIHFDVQSLAYGKLPPHHQGAELGAPADPSEQFSAARPEWYYLFLFQLLKYFHGTQEFVGAIVIPGVVMTLLALMPFTGRSQIGHRLNVAFVVLLFIAAGVLTGLAWQEDANNPDFQAAKVAAAADAERIVELVNRREWVYEQDGGNGDGNGAGKLSDRRLIQNEGAVYLLRNDPLTRGPKLFAQHCASCHNYVKPKGDKAGNPETDVYRFQLLQSPKTKANGEVERNAAGDVVYDDAPAPFGAPNLYGFASRDWIRGLLNKDRIADIDFLPPTKAVAEIDPKDKEKADAYKRPVVADYFGNTYHRDGRMVKWVTDHAELLKDNPEKADDTVDAIVAALSAQAQLRSQANVEEKDHALIERGVVLIEQNCANGCHRIGEVGQLGLAPDLTGYGSYEWMIGFLSDPTHSRFYRFENDRMPSFAANLDNPATNTVSVRELSLIVDWIRGDYYLPDDEKPVLAHSEEEARKTAVLARTREEPQLIVIGAPEAKPESKQHYVERLFKQNCAACHNHLDANGRGIAARQPSAPNLFGFASRDWLTGLLTPAKAEGPEYFGNTAHVDGDMVTFVKDDLGELDDDQKKTLNALVAALSAEAALPAQAEADKKSQDDGTLEKGKTALGEAITNSSCLDCHKFHDTDDGDGPDLTGYGSREWLVRMISDPEHELLYNQQNDRMPAFRKDKDGPGTIKPLLTEHEIDLLARWLRGEKLE